MLLCVATLYCLVNSGLRVPGIDPSPTVFGVVKRIRDDVWLADHVHMIIDNIFLVYDTF